MKKKPVIRFLLSNREIEILNLMIYDDMSPDQVSKKLSISPGTVNWHLENIRGRYEVPTTIQAIVLYIKEKHKIEATAEQENSCLS